MTLHAASDDKPLFDYDALAHTAAGIIGGHFKLYPVPLGVSVDYGPAPPGTAYAETWSWDKLSGDKPWPNGCHIKVWDQKFAGLGGEDAASVMAHEVFHCYQHQQVGNAKDMATVHRWIVEGEPTWVMAALHPTATVFQKDWQADGFSPYRSYSDRGQDAIGVLGHLDDVTGGSGSAVWDHLLTLDAIGVGGNDAGPFSLLIQGNETPDYMSWGSSYFETPGNASWRMVSPASAPTSGPPPGQANVAPGSVIHAAVGQYQAGLMQVDASADIVAVLLMTGYGRLHDNGFALETPLDSSGPLVLCMKQGGCRCPDGSPGASLITRPAVSPLSIGIDGGDVVGDLTLAGKSIDDFCKKPDQKSPSDPGGGGGGGGGGPDNPPPDEPRHDGGQAVYDTHVTTFDGLHYDFQAVGEYTLVRSTKDDFAIQTRQVPVLKSKTVTVNQAVATKIGDGVSRSHSTTARLCSASTER